MSLNIKIIFSHLRVSFLWYELSWLTQIVFGSQLDDNTEVLNSLWFEIEIDVRKRHLVHNRNVWDVYAQLGHIWTESVFLIKVSKPLI